VGLAEARSELLDQSRPRGEHGLHVARQRHELHIEVRMEDDHPDHDMM